MNDEKYLKPIKRTKKRPLGDITSAFNAVKKHKLDANNDACYAATRQVVQNDSDINSFSEDNFVSAFLKDSFDFTKPKALSFNSSDSSSISSSDDDRSVSPTI